MPDFMVKMGDAVWDKNALFTYSGNHPVLLFCRNWLNGLKAVTIKTSGSSGPPKSISLNRDWLKQSAKASATFMNPTSKDQWLLSLNIQSIGGLMIVVRAMEWDIPLEIVETSGNPMALLDSTHTNTFCSLVPLQLFEIMKDEESLKKLNRFRIILLGGAPLSQEQENKIQALSPTIYHTYGMTETCSHIAFKQLNQNKKEAHFKLLPQVSVNLSNDGTLVINSPFASENPLVTNDLAILHSPQEFDVIGRKDRTLISGGIKIQLEELEELFSSQIQVPFYLDGIPDEKLGRKLVLVMESQEEESAHLLKQLKSIAPRYKDPKAIIFVARFERTASGKIDRISTSQKWARTN